MYIYYIVPDYNTLVLESSFHGNEGMMCGREYVGWYVGNIGFLIIKVYVFCSIDRIKMVRINGYQHLPDMSLEKSRKQIQSCQEVHVR